MPKAPPTPPGPTPALSPPGNAADQRAQRLQRNRAVLNRIIEVGNVLIDLVEQVAIERAREIHSARPVPKHPASDLSDALDRIGRTIRRTMALDEKLEELAQAQPRLVQPRSLAQHRTDARKAIIREVEDAISETADEADAKALREEFYVRLDAPDFEDDLRHRPVEDIIRDLCVDFGLDDTDGLNSSRRRTPEDIARLCARAAAPSAPRDPRPGTDPPPRPPRH